MTDDCAGCHEEIDVREDTHYRVGEETRPVPEPADADEPRFSDFFVRGWLVCESCMAEVIADD